MNPKRADGSHGRRWVWVGLVLALALTWCPGLSGSPGGSALAAEATHLDLNRASLEEVLQLPISEELARHIIDHRDYVRYYDNVYQLLEIEGMTPEIFAQLPIEMQHELDLTRRMERRNAANRYAARTIQDLMDDAIRLVHELDLALSLQNHHASTLRPRASNRPPAITSTVRLPSIGINKPRCS